MKTAVKLVAAWTGIFLIAAICLEAGLRFFSPLPAHGGVYRDRGGNVVPVARDEITLRPNLDVIHSSSEFSAEIQTDEFGFRKIANKSTTPDYLFIGDSFTFGHGVGDAEVFSSIFCRSNHVTCLNLGRSGTDTFDQLRILRHAIDTWGIRPKNVTLVMLAACALDVSGNDLKDNLSHAGAKRSAARPRVAVARLEVEAPGPDVWGLLKKVQGWIGDYEITKRVMLVVSKGLKRGLYSCTSDTGVEAALKATDVALAELEALAKEKNFRVDVFAIHPYQELDGAFHTTERYLRRLSPRQLDWHFTGQYFRPEHYYPYDGHWNAGGHARMAAVVENALMGKMPRVGGF